MSLKEFKKLVDNSKKSLNTTDLIEVSNFLKIDIKNGASTQKVAKKLYENISSALNQNTQKQEGGLSKRDLKKLQTELVYRHVLYGDDPTEYLKILKVIDDSCRRNLKFYKNLENKKAWKKAIINAKNYNYFAPNTHTILFNDIRKDYPKEYDIASSNKKLIEKGCDIIIENSDFKINNGLEKVVQELDDKVKFFGGLSLAKTIFSFFENKKIYSEKFERYFITRTSSGISFDQKPQIPFGYLLNLSLKHLVENNKLKKPQKYLTEIIDLSTIITNAVYGIQHYSLWETFFQTGDTIIKFATDVVLWDSIFTIPQCRPKTALKITNEIFEFIDDHKFEEQLKVSREQLISIINSLNNNAKKNGPTIIYLSTIEKELKNIEKAVILGVLNLLSHQSKTNGDYVLPSDYTKIDFFLKPLIKLGKTKFLLIDKSWSAPNYFEAISTELRQYDKNLDGKIGAQLEILLQNTLNKNEITFSTGEYCIDGIDGECDLLIESKDAIILIEFKKKVLTRKSKSGIDINILLDLSESLLSAQIQAGRTEIFLKEKKEIELITREGKKEIIKLNDRHVERVALTQLEFGGFQDRTVVKNFLKALLTHSFGTYSKDKLIVKKFDKLSEMQKKWIEQYDRLLQLDEHFNKNPFFNCWFMSLPQLLEIVYLSNSNDSFYEIFKKNKHVTMNTLDWYREFDIATKMIKNNSTNNSGESVVGGSDY